MHTPHILVVDDEQDIRELISDILDDEGYEVSIAGNALEANQLYSQTHLDLVLLDIWMPDADGISVLQGWQEEQALTCPVVMMSGHGTVETAVQATRLGASDFIEKPIALAKLLATVKHTLEQGITNTDTQDSTTDSRTTIPAPQGKSSIRQALQRQMQQLADHPHHYCIIGSKGTRKNTIAGWIHQNSAQQSMACINIEHSDHLEALLKKNNNASTWLLNAEHLPDFAIQNRLCAALENKTTRLVLLSEVSPSQLLEEQCLCESLYFSLSSAVIYLKPLSQHIEDIPDLVRFYTELLPDLDNLPYRHMSLAAQNCLRQYAWPGNEQELINMIKQLLLLGNEGEITLSEVEQLLTSQTSQTSQNSNSHSPNIFDQPLRQAREDFEREYLIYHLQCAAGSVGQMAERVGMERTHLYRKLRGLGLDPKQVSRSSE